MSNLKGQEPAPNTARTRGSITIKYNTHRIIITIIIVLIKNYYVNSYLTTCMAQSIKLVSCNNNNKDTTIYLLVSLSRVSICVFFFNFITLYSTSLIYSSNLLFIFFIFFCNHPSTRYCINPHAYFAFNSTLLVIEKTGNFQISINVNHFFLSPSIIVIYNIIMYK